MDLERKEILSTYQTLMNSLGLPSRLETLFPLTHEDAYLHIFQTLFPEKILNIMKIASQNEFIKGDRIQSLIDLLSKDVLSIDLTHIRGSLIAKKNLNHILNFLQILLEISNAQKEQAQAHAMTIEQQRKYQEVSKKFGVEDMKEERISHVAVQEEPAHKDKNEDSINDLLGGEDSGVEEIADILYRPKRKTRAGSDDELSDEEIEGGYEQYRTEAAPEDRQDSGVQRKRASSSERDVKKKVKNFEEEDELLSNAGKIKRAYIPDDDDEERIFRKLEEDGQISPDNLKYDRVDKYSRKYGKKTKKAPIAQEEEGEEQYILNEREGFSDKPLKPNFDPKNVQVRYLGKGPYVVEQSLSYKPAKSVAKQVMNLRPHTAVVTVQSQDDPDIDKYEIKRISQQQRRKTGQRDEDSDEEEERRQVKVSGGETRYVRVGEENMLYNVLSDNINNVRRDLKGIKEHNLPDDEPLTQELLMRQKNTYQNYLSEFMKLQKTKEKKLVHAKNKNSRNFSKDAKTRIISDQRLEDDLNEQQKSVFLKLRDDKVNYMRHIHKVVFELEKKKLIDDKSRYMEMRKTKNDQTRNVMESIENMYRDKITMLRERQANDHRDRKGAESGQAKLLGELKKEIGKDKFREIQTLKNKWRNEKEKFKNMVKVDGYLAKQILNTYKQIS